jgi:hypothetical protein
MGIRVHDALVVPYGDLSIMYGSGLIMLCIHGPQWQGIGSVPSGAGLLTSYQHSPEQHLLYADP